CRGHPTPRPAGRFAGVRVLSRGGGGRDPPAAAAAWTRGTAPQIGRSSAPTPFPAPPGGTWGWACGAGRACLRAGGRWPRGAGRRVRDVRGRVGRQRSRRGRAARTHSVAMATGLHTIDVVMVLTYLAALAGVGIYFSRRQSTLSDFFLARQSMAWLPVGLSLMAALNSGIDYLMQPASTIKYGLILLVGTSSWMFLYPWVARVTLPFYRRLGVFTAYEFLETRFDVRVRLLAAGIFIIWRLGWMATAIYVPCLAINAATSGAADLTAMIVVLGALVTLYTTLGGVQAVIWNDVMQFCIMFGGLPPTLLIPFSTVPAVLPEISTA